MIDIARWTKLVFASFVLGGLSMFGLAFVATFFVREPEIGRLFETVWVPGLLLLMVCWFPLVRKKLK